MTTFCIGFNGPKTTGLNKFYVHVIHGDGRPLDQQSEYLRRGGYAEDGTGYTSRNPQTFMNCGYFEDLFDVEAAIKRYMGESNKVPNLTSKSKKVRETLIKLPHRTKTLLDNIKFEIRD